MNPSRLFLAILFLPTTCWLSIANACEGCKMSAVNGMSESQTVRAGFALSWSVLFMLAIVFLLLASFAWFVRTACKEVDDAHQRKLESSHAAL